ncbi:phosphatidylinositol-binding clathrin assembly protein LAP-like isoform X6 [Rhynchophorus ferrugineus]
MMCYGNERFTQFLASNNSTFQLSNFLDKGGLQGYDMSPFIRRYARYLNEKALSYRSVAFDFCKVKRGKDDGMLRTMNADKLLKTIPVLQGQLDALLEFDCAANDLTNGIINMCFMLLFRDLIRLFACYNDGIINLLEKYFDMNKKQCKEALDIYKKFLVRMDSVAEFLKVAENVGIDKGDIPDLTKAPSSLLDALEQHYSHMEGKKSAANSTASSSSSSNQKNVKSGVTALSSTSNAFGTAASSSKFDSLNGIDENLKQKALAEEEAAMNQFKSKVSSPASNPFLSGPVSPATLSSQSTPAVDLFSAGPMPTPQPKASDDLLQLSNPFADAFAQPPSLTTSSMPPFAVQQQTSAWVANGNASGQFDPLGGVLQPINSSGQAAGGNNNPPDPSSGVLGNSEASNGNGGLLTGDLESSLASLAENLTISDRKQTLKGVQWNAAKGSSKPNWTPQPMSATTGAGYKPMNQQLNNAPFSTTLTAPQVASPFMSQPLYPQMTQMVVKPMAPVMSPLNPMPQQPSSLGSQQHSLLFH